MSPFLWAPFFHFFHFFLSAFWKYNTENTERKRPTLLKEKSFGSNVDCQDCWAKTAMRARTGHDKTFARVVQNCAKSEAAVNESLVVTQINPVYIGQKSCSCWREQKWHFRRTTKFPWKQTINAKCVWNKKAKKGGWKKIVEIGNATGFFDWEKLWEFDIGRW